MAPRALARMLVEKLRAAYGDRKRGRWVLWGIGAYGAAALVCTAAWLVIGPQAAEQTGLRRELFLVNRFAGAPLRTEVSDGISLDFLDEDERFPQRHFSARWRGYWYVPDGGSIAIHGTGDDWLSVYIDGELVLRRYPPDQMHWATEVVTLAAGAHELLIEYEQEAGAYALDVRWSPPSDRMRPFAGHRLFRRPPSMDDVRLAQRAAWFGWVVTLLWVAPLLTVVGIGVRRVWRAYERFGLASLRFVVRGVRVATVSAVAVIAVQAAIARLPGWNPESLWADDLVYAAIVRSQDVWSMITAPIHVAPGLFLIWRGLYALFPDPEWSLQLLPFACGIVSIAVMALVVQSVTRDYGLAILAAALTALNPLLAHYTVFVHQYPFDFLVTALFLLAAAHLLRNPGAFSPRLFGWVALGGGVAAFFSVTSVFMSFPTVNLGAALALRGWRRDRTRTIKDPPERRGVQRCRAGRLPVPERPVERDGARPLRDRVHAAGVGGFGLGLSCPQRTPHAGTGAAELGSGRTDESGDVFLAHAVPGPRTRLAVGAAPDPVPGARRSGLLRRIRHRERIADLPAGDRPCGYLRVSAVDLSVYGRRAPCHAGAAGAQAHPAGGGDRGHGGRRDAPIARGVLQR